MEADVRASKEKTEWVALKNNLLYDAAATPNLQLEIRLAPQWSLEVGAGFNPFPLDDTKFPKWRHVSAHIAPRYWFCHVFHRDFISLNAAYVHYNVAGGRYPIGWMYPQVKDNRYQGDAVMAGLSYGWHFAISPHFSVELEAGVDAGYSWYDRFECKHCGQKTAQGGRWLVLPKAGINISVPLGGDKASLARRCDCEQIEEKPEEPEVARLPAERLYAMSLFEVAPVMPVVPPFEVKVDQMRRLRSALLRNEEEYEPYTESMALSADPRNVFIYFDVNVTKMDRSFIQNNLLMDSILFILGDALSDSTMRITRIQIVGFASFDGRLNSNIRLAGSRAATIKEYMQSQYPLPDSLFAVCNGGESWAELLYQLPKVEFEGRDEVLDIIRTEPDYDLREAKIKKLHRGETYRYMRDELKHILRNLGCITVYCETVD
jgi:outer membrane protein OmpA-like peptidoglycan-associated protein